MRSSIHVRVVHRHSFGRLADRVARSPPGPRPPRPMQRTTRAPSTSNSAPASRPTAARFRRSARWARQASPCSAARPARQRVPLVPIRTPRRTHGDDRPREREHRVADEQPRVARVRLSGEPARELLACPSPQVSLAQDVDEDLVAVAAQERVEVEARADVRGERELEQHVARRSRRCRQAAERELGAEREIRPGPAALAAIRRRRGSSHACDVSTNAYGKMSTSLKPASRLRAMRDETGGRD